MSGLAVFDEVLDPEVLRNALENVVKRPGWERLGGRLKNNVSSDYSFFGLLGLPWHDVANRKILAVEDDRRLSLTRRACK